jgi:hypothetical protein
VGTTNSQVLTNKTLTAPTIATITNGGTLTLPSGTLTLVARSTTDTLTNKTLTSPVVADLLATLIRAIDANGVSIKDDGANLGLFVQDGGNVGVAQAAPQAPLHVGPGADAPAQTGTAIYASNAGLTAITARNSTDDVEVLMAASTSSALFSVRTNHPFRFLTNNTEQMRITETGLVGIGTTGPTAKLGVIQSSTTAAIPTARLQQSDLSEQFIDFVSTVGASNAISTAALGAYYGKVRVSVNGTFKWMALYD